jgi:S-(hydroxymethyl)glutathione dehydrogenase/alcohol dehydrogenase
MEEVNRFQIRDDVTTRPVGPQDVKVRMRAAGVCHTEVSIVSGAWPTKLPTVLGHEGAGEVVEVGSAVQHIHPGQRVILAPLAACDRCYFCLHGQPYLCELIELEGDGAPTFDVAGMASNGIGGLGTWSQEVVVLERNVVAFDDSIPYEIASLVGCAVMTGVGAVLNTAHVDPGDSIVVIGGGGIGSSVVQGARLAGAGVILAVDPAVGKHENLKRFGATHTAVPEQLDEMIRDLTAGRGFDHAFENVGHPETIRSAWDAARHGGEVIVTGIGGHAAKVEFDAFELAIDAKTLIGNQGGSVNPRRDFPRYLNLWQLGKLDLEGLITDRITLDDTAAALDALGTRPDVGRQVILFD